MLKKSLIAIAVLAIAMPAFAGSLKIHDPWATTYVKEPVVTLDVQLDVGYYIHIVDQNPITVTQTGTDDPYHTYYGCKTTDVITNFDAELDVECTATSAAGGSWSGTITPSTVTAGTTSADICVTGTGVQIELLTGGTKTVKVATATVTVKPQ